MASRQTQPLLLIGHEKFVENHIEGLKRKNIPGCKEALEFLDDLLDQMS